MLRDGRDSQQTNKWTATARAKAFFGRYDTAYHPTYHHQDQVHFIHKTLLAYVQSNECQQAAAAQNRAHKQMCVLQQWATI